jgi:hypothetical protein
MDWSEVLAADAENPRARLAAELLASATYGSTAERVNAFVEQGGGCRATFFNYRRYLLGTRLAGWSELANPLNAYAGFSRWWFSLLVRPQVTPRAEAFWIASLCRSARSSVSSCAMAPSI